MRIETNRDRAASMVQKNEAVATARQKVLEQRLAAQGCTDYLFGAINRHSAEAPAVCAVPMEPQRKAEPPKVVAKATDTMRALSVLAALAVISVIVCMNALWFM